MLRIRLTSASGKLQRGVGRDDQCPEWAEDTGRGIFVLPLRGHSHPSASSTLNQGNQPREPLYQDIEEQH